MTISAFPTVSDDAKRNLIAWSQSVSPRARGLISLNSLYALIKHSITGREKKNDAWTQAWEWVSKLNATTRLELLCNADIYALSKVIEWARLEHDALNPREVEEA